MSLDSTAIVIQQTISEFCSHYFYFHTTKVQTKFLLVYDRDWVAVHIYNSVGCKIFNLFSSSSLKWPTVEIQEGIVLSSYLFFGRLFPGCVPAELSLESCGIHDLGGSES